MSVSPEERAKAVMQFFRENCSEAVCTFLDCPSCGCMAYIATAIREAENAKLEEAAALIEPGRDLMQANIAKHFPGEEDAVFAMLGGLIVEFANACMSDIRSLKKD